jgi:hypothetical protein
MGCAAAVMLAPDRAAAYSLLPPYLRDCAASEPPPAPLAAPAAPAAAAKPLPLPLVMKECCICFLDVQLEELRLLAPCGHRCVCEACGDALVAMPPATRVCPVCDKAVACAVRVFDIM